MPTNTTATTRTPTPKQVQQEYQILWRFRNVFQDVHSSLSRDGAILTPEEDRTLALMYQNPAPTLLAATAVTFGALRSMRYAWRVVRGSNSYYSLQQPKRPLYMGMILDTSIGVIVGGTGLFAGALRMEMNEQHNGLASIPLQPGRSTISNHFCDPLIQEYQRQWFLATGGQQKPPFQTLGDYLYGWSNTAITPWERQDILDQPTNKNLRAYLEFVQNCRKRQELEKKLRQARGMARDEVVDIPPPGVVLQEDSSSKDWKLVSSTGSVPKD